MIGSACERRRFYRYSTAVVCGYGHCVCRYLLKLYCECAVCRNALYGVLAVGELYRRAVEHYALNPVAAVGNGAYYNVRTLGVGVIRERRRFYLYSTAVVFGYGYLVSGHFLERYVYRVVAVDFLNGVCAACDSAESVFLGLCRRHGLAVKRYALDIRSVFCVCLYVSVLTRKHLACFGFNRAEGAVVFNGKIYGAAYLAYNKGKLERVGAQVGVAVSNGQLITAARVFDVGRVERERAVLCERNPVRERYAVCKRKDIGVCAAAEKSGKRQCLLAVVGVEHVCGLCVVKLLYGLCHEIHPIAAD